jgi:hypothetical protein
MKVGFYFIQNDFGLGVAKFILNSWLGYSLGKNLAGCGGFLCCS